MVSISEDQGDSHIGLAPGQNGFVQKLFDQGLIKQKVVGMDF